MLSTILSWLGGLLGGPFATAAVNAYKAKLDADNNADKIAAELAGRELAMQTREIELQTQLRIAQIGKWYEPEHLIGYAVAFIIGKVLIWDMCLGLGSTPEPRGWIASVTNLVVMFYFGKRGIENVARILKR
jgi:hypothetical protein